VGLSQANVCSTAAWLTGRDRPTALVERTYRMPLVQAAMRQAGLEMGKDLDVVGIGNPIHAEHGEYTCVSERYDEISLQVAEIMLSEDKSLDRAARHVIVPPTLVLCKRFDMASARKL